MSVGGIKERFETAVPGEQIDHAKKLNVLIIRTTDLLFLIRQFEDISDNKQKFLEILRSGGGWLQVTPTGYQVISSAEQTNVTKLETFRDVFMAKKPFVCPINAYTLNERLVIQHGTFPCPGDISIPFEENLTALATETDSKPDFGNHLWEIRIENDPPDLRKKILRKLHRMNMNRATLYPGLDGFAQSLEILLMGFPEILIPDREWAKAMKDGSRRPRGVRV